MTLFGMLACGLGSAAGGGVLVGALAASVVDSLPILFACVSVGALAGSMLGWHCIKGRNRLFEARPPHPGILTPSDRL